MRTTRFWLAFVVALVATTVVGCGGGGHGLQVPNNPIIITSNALPAVNSGEPVNYSIPFSGGAGGPYKLEVIQGVMPAGIALDEGTVALVGQPLEDGTFNFRLKLTDLGTSPATTSIMEYEWIIGIGALVLVSDPVLPSWVYNRFDTANLVIAGGVPPYTAVDIGDPNLPVNNALPTGLSIPAGSTAVVGAPIETVGENSSVTPPLTYHVPVQISDSSVPVLTTVVTIVVEVQIPPLVITTTAVGNGTCGTQYVDAITTADGIPPFLHSIIHNVPPLGTLANVGSSYRMMGEPGTPNGVAKGTADSAYPLDTDASTTYVDRFPEGIFIRDGTGDLLGIPRRKGTFQNWKYMVQSRTLTAVPSQNVTKTFTFSMADSYPGSSVTMSPTATILAPSQGYVAPNNFLKNAEFGRTYDYSYSATGGVPQDGAFDAAHETGQVANPAETAGAFDWSTTTFAVEPPGNYNMAFEANGRFHTLSASGATAKFGPRNVFPRALDAMLPTLASPATGHVATGTNQFSIGPDVLVITESLGSMSGAGLTIGMQYPDNQNLEIVQAFTLGPVVAAPSYPGDYTAGQASNPSTASGAWANVDFMTVTVNPTWWAYDSYNLNAKGARAGYGADPERTFPGQGVGTDGIRKNMQRGCPPEVHSGSYVYGYSTPYTQGFEHAANLAVDLPACTSGYVTHDPSVGRYTDGGLLYAYTREPSPGSGEFGILIVRRDGKLHVPFCISRGTYDGFGDAWIGKGATVPSILKQPQMTVSPDGRIAAMKIKNSVTTWNESASGQKILLFSLTGEGYFGGSTYKLIDVGPSGVGTRNQYPSTPLSLGYYLYADSLTLTNRYLYYITGNYGDSGQYYYAMYNVCKEHWIWHYDVTGGQTAINGASLGTATVGSLVVFSDPYVPSYFNTAGYPMQSPFHAWYTPGCSSYSMPTTGYYSGQNGQGTYSPGNAGPNPSFYGYHWANFSVSSKAPHPFRVSANGKLCAYLAGITSQPFNSGFGYQSSSYPSSPSAYPMFGGNIGPEMYAVWTEFDGGQAANTFPTTRRINNTYSAPYVGTIPWRHFRPPNRPGQWTGEEYNRTQGWFDGPGTQMEVSDDGTKVACVWNDPAGPNYGYSYWYYNGGYYYSSPYGGWFGKEDILSWIGTGASTDPWSVTTERHVTRTPTTGSVQFFPMNPSSYNAMFRMGCLHFTRDGNGLVFWVGLTNNGYGYSSNYDNNSFLLTGSLYAAVFSGTTVTSVRGLISSTTQGGSSDGTRTYWNGSSATTSSITFSTYGGGAGGILPTGCFTSNNGSFFYVCSEWALDSSGTSSQNNSGGTSHRLIGINVATATGSAINGKSPLAPFFPSWLSGSVAWHRGFGPVGGGYWDWYYSWYYPQVTGYAYDYRYYTQTTAHRVTANMSTSTNWLGNIVGTRGNRNLVFWVGYYQNTTLGDFKYNSAYYNYLTNNFMSGAWPSATSDWGSYLPEVMGFDAGVGGDPFKLTNLGSTQLTYNGPRTIPYMQLDDSGRRLAFVESQAYNPAYYYYGGFDHQINRERLWLVSNIDTTSTGALNGIPAVVQVESSEGRVSSAIAHDTIGMNLYYGYYQGTGGNENQQALTQATIGGGGSSVSSKRTMSGLLQGSGLARFAVIQANR